MNMENKKEEPKQIRVPMPTFPPTAMVYSLNKVDTVHIEPKTNAENSVPMTLIAKVLTQREPTKRPRRTYICDRCKQDYVFVDKCAQTERSGAGGGGNGGGSSRRSSDSDSVHSNSGLAASYVHKPSRTKTNSTETEI